MSKRRIVSPAQLAAIVTLCIGSTALAQTGTAPSAASSGAAKATSASLASGDRKFVEKAAAGGMAEVQLGQMAAQKASADDVRKFGQRMVDDHGKANDQLKQLATSKSVELPAEVDGATKREMDKLSKLEGAAFDREYMNHMVSDHKKDVSEFRSESRKAKDADVKQFATTTLPTLEEHLKLAQAAQKVANGEARTSSSSTAATKKTGT